MLFAQSHLKSEFRCVYLNPLFEIKLITLLPMCYFRQKIFEEALLRSGQYNDAFVSLFEWINKIDSLLNDNENKGCAGDVETVKVLILFSINNHAMHE